MAVSISLGEHPVHNARMNRVLVPFALKTESSDLPLFYVWAEGDAGEPDFILGDSDGHLFAFRSHVGCLRWLQQHREFGQAAEDAPAPPNLIDAVAALADLGRAEVPEDHDNLTAFLGVLDDFAVAMNMDMSSESYLPLKDYYCALLEGQPEAFFENGCKNDDLIAPAKRIFHRLLLQSVLLE